MSLSVTGYDKGQDRATLIVTDSTTGDKFVIANVDTAQAAKSKIDVDAIVKRQKEIISRNQKYIDAKIASITVKAPMSKASIDAIIKATQAGQGEIGGKP